MLSPHQILALLSVAAAAAAEVGLSPLFLNATLQHGVNTAVWGMGATPNTTVVVSVGKEPDPDATATATTADASGRWGCVLPPHPVSWGIELSVKNGAASTSTTVKYGVVVLCAGQSNMDMPVGDYNLTKFHADNGTAECAASGRYSGKISIRKAVQTKYSHGVLPAWEEIRPTPPTGCNPEQGWPAWPRCASNLGAFSAVCWYSGRNLFDKMGGSTPVGLMQASVGGSPIEYWLPPTAPYPPSTVNSNPCETDSPQCDNQYNDSTFWVDIVQQYTVDNADVVTNEKEPGLGYTVGAIVWDQAERDVKCPVSTAAYGCMQRFLATSWRKRFGNPSAAFVAVQLPGYTGALANGTGVYPGYISAAMVFEMRLQEAAGTVGLANASFVPTYDQSCSDNVTFCPFGSVHNVQKTYIGARVADQILKIWADGGVAAQADTGPYPTSATATASSGGGGGYTVTVRFAGGSPPWYITGTKNCSHCCGGSHPTGKITDGHTVDFDAVGNAGGPWVNSTGMVLDPLTGVATFQVSVSEPVAEVRHTAAAIFPECAIYAAEGLPARPFRVRVSQH